MRDEKQIYVAAAPNSVDPITEAMETWDMARADFENARYVMLDAQRDLIREIAKIGAFEFLKLDTARVMQAIRASKGRD